MIFAEIKNKTVDFAKKQYEFFVEVLSKKSNSYKKTAVIALVMVGVILLPIFPFSTLTLAYEVKYDDTSVGYVSTVSEYEQAETLVTNTVVGDIEGDIEVNTTIVSTASLSSVDEISTSITANIVETGNVVTAHGIYVDRKCIAASDDKKLLLNAIESYKSDVEAESGADIVVFAEDVQVKDCLSFSKKFTNIEETVDVIKENVDCKAGFYKTKTKTVKYKTIEKKDKTLYAGLSKVKTKGENGKKKVKTLTFYQDGKKVSTETVKTTTLKKSKNKVVIKGTKKRPEANTKGKKYLWPLDRDASCYISSNYGQRSGRLHKGVDIIADYGVKILAAADGKVVRASWFESYGYCVDIKHSDGTLTRYAHCSKILVNVGDQVVMGQKIAKVGSTGRSTANHLHFEVRPNCGDPVNPMKYVKK